MTSCCDIETEIEGLESEIEKEFFEEVLVSLGGSLVDVELCLSDLRVAFKKAKRVFIQKGHNTYRRVFLPVKFETGTMTYPIPDNIDTIVRVLGGSESGMYNTEDAFTMQAFNDLFSRGTCENGLSNKFLEYEMTLQKLEQHRIYGAGDMQFSHDKFRNTLRLLKSPRGGIVLIDCYANLEDIEYMQIDWMIRWTITEAKLLLGIAYRKFQSVASPNGEVSLSGSEYVQEAKEEQRLLLEEIEQLVDGDSDYYGVYVI